MDIDNAIKLVGASPDYLDTRGVIYLSLKQTQDAIKDLQSAVEADPSPAKLFHLAQAYLQANDKEKAKQYWKDAREKKLDQLGTTRVVSIPWSGLPTRRSLANWDRHDRRQTTPS